MQRLFNTNDTAYVTPGRCDFIQGGVVAGYGSETERSTATILPPSDTGEIEEPRGLGKRSNIVSVEGYLIVPDVRDCREVRYVSNLHRSIDACFLKWAVASDKRVWVSLVKEAPDTGGIPSPNAPGSDSELAASRSTSSSVWSRIFHNFK